MIIFVYIFSKIKDRIEEAPSSSDLSSSKIDFPIYY